MDSITARMDWGPETDVSASSMMADGAASNDIGSEKRPIDLLSSLDIASPKRRRTGLSVDSNDQEGLAGDGLFGTGDEVTVHSSASSIFQDPKSAVAEESSGRSAAVETPNNMPLESYGLGGAGTNGGVSPSLAQVPRPTPGPSSTSAEPQLPRWFGHMEDSDNIHSIKMATETRPYRMLEGSDGLLTSSLGSLIPGGYQFHQGDSEWSWICPIRTCRRLFTSRAAMGGHFNKHRRTLLNDNGDGTFSIVGTYAKQILGESGLPAVVVSQIPGDPNEKWSPPMRVPPQYQPISSSQAKDIRPPAASQARDPRPPAANGDTSSINVSALPSALPSAIPSATPSALPSASVSSSVHPNGIAAHAPYATDAYKAAIKNATESGGKVTANDFTVPIPGDPARMWNYVRPYMRQTVHPPKTGYVPEVLGLPRVRDIQWNTEWPNGYFESLPRDVSALIMHVVGDRPPASCTRCDQGKGPFHGCIVMPANGPLTPIVSCSNCWYHGYQVKCSLQTHLRERLPAKLASPASVPVLVDQSIGGSSPAVVPNTWVQPSNPPETIRRQDSPAFSQLPHASPVPPQAVNTHPHHPAVQRTPHHQSPVVSTPPVATFSRQPHQAGSLPASSSASSVMMQGHTHMPVEALEMEDWEVGPGQVASRVAPEDNIAFSNAYLSTNHSVAVANGISFRVEIVRPGTSRIFEPERCTTRICSLASGKLKVYMQDEPELSIGPNGMFKIRPGIQCTVENRIYMDCILHVSTVTTEDDF